MVDRKRMSNRRSWGILCLSFRPETAALKTILVITSITLLLAALLGTLAWQSRASIAADLLSKRLGAAITIDELEIKSPGRVTDIALKGIRLSHVMLAEEATIESIQVAIDLAQLIDSGTLYFPNLEVSNANLKLSGEPLQQTKNDQIVPVIRNWRFHAVTLGYTDDDQDITAVVNNCAGVTEPGQLVVSVSCDMLLNDAALQATGRYGLPDRQLPRMSHQLDISWGDILMTVRGRMDNPAQLAGADLKLTLTGPSTKPLRPLLGIDEFRDGAFDLNVGIVDLGRSLNLKLQATAAGFEADVAGTVSYPSPFDSINATFQLQGPSLYEYGALFDYLAFEPLPFKFSGSVSKDGQTLSFDRLEMQLAEGTLNGAMTIPDLTTANGLELSLSGKDFSPNVIQPLAPNCRLPTTPMDWHGAVSVNDAGAEMLTLNIKGASHTLSVNGLWFDPQGLKPRQLKIRTEGATLAELGQCIGMEVNSALQTQGTATVRMQPHGWEVIDLNLSTPDFELKGSLSVSDTKPRDINADLEITTASLKALANALFETTGPLRDTPAVIHAALTSEGEQLLLKELTLTSDDFNGTASGTLTDRNGLAGLDLTTRLSGDNLLALLEDAERVSKKAAPFKASAEINRSRDGWRLENINATIAQATVSGHLNLTDRPRFLGSSASIRTEGQSLENLLGPWVDYPLPALAFSADASAKYDADLLEIRDLAIEVGAHRLSGNLVIDNPPDLSRSQGTLQLKGPSTHEFLALTGSDFPMLDRPYAIDFTLTGATDTLTLQDFTLKAGETMVSGRGDFENGEKPWLDLNLSSPSFYLPLIKPSLLEESTDTESPSGRLFATTPLNTSWLNRAEGQIRLDVDRLWVTEEHSTRINGTLTLKQGTLASRDLKWKGGQVSGSTRFSASDTANGLSLSFDSTSSRLPIIWLLAGDPEASKGTSARLQFDTTGPSIAEMMANANGKLLFKGGAGTIKAGLLEGIFGDILHTLTDRVYGRSRSRTTRLDCSAGAITIANGRASVHPGIAFRTERVEAFFTGDIDLRAEEPNLTMLTRPRTGIGVSAAGAVAPRITMTGSLASPKYSIDTRSAALATGLAYFSGGASLLASGLWNRLVRGTTDPCQALYHQAAQQPEFQF